MGAPIGSQVLGEVLPYLGVVKDNEKEEDVKKEVEVPNIVGMTLKQGKEALKNVGLDIDIEVFEQIEGEDKEENNQMGMNNDSVIQEQLPKPGIKTREGNKVSVK